MSTNGQHFHQSARPSGGSSTESSSEAESGFPDIPHRAVVRLQPITKFSVSLGAHASNFSSSASSHSSRIVTNSAIIDFLLRLLCSEKENDPARCELLCSAARRLIQQCNGDLYLPLYEFPQLHTFNIRLQKLFERLFVSNRLSDISTVPIFPLSRNLTLFRKETYFQPNSVHSNRYRKEFEQELFLGSGGFGRVYRVKHRLDGRHYAIKMIPLRKHNTTNEKIIREVHTLAQLEHPNIVRYYTAWFEPHWHMGDEMKRESRPRVMGLERRYRMRESLKITEIQSEKITVTSESVIFQNDPQSDVKKKMNQTSHCIDDLHQDSVQGSKLHQQKPAEFSNLKLKSVENARKIEMFEIDIKKTLGESVESNYSDSCSKSGGQPDGIGALRGFELVPFQPNLPYNLFSVFSPDIKVTLFIQMGLCGMSLDKWLRHRVKHPAVNLWQRVDEQHCLLIFQQVLQAVEYIHSQRVVHRDLKPANIFFSEDMSRVQLGDFGLARLFPSHDPRGRVDSTPLSPLVERQSHTHGIGTHLYIAPELIQGGPDVDCCKVDMFSLGVILLELFHPFGTECERCAVIGQLRGERKLTPEFNGKWPEVANWVIRLTNSEPSARPTASDLMQSHLLDMSIECGKCRDNDKEFMRQVIKQRDYRIGELKFEVESLQSQLATLQTTRREVAARRRSV